MKTTISINRLLLGILFLALAYLTATGTIQNYINFTGAKNEFAFLGLTSLMGVMLIAISFDKTLAK